MQANELRYEKEAENRATIYRPKTPLKGEWKLQFYECSAFFYDRVLRSVFIYQSIVICYQNIVGLSTRYIFLFNSYSLKIVIDD